MITRKRLTMTSYALDASWGGAVECPPYKILAKVQDGKQCFQDYWVILGLEHGFIGMPVGGEREADMSALPGLLWEDVEALGTTVEPGTDAKVSAAFNKIDALMHTHNGTTHEAHDHAHVHDHEDGHTHGAQRSQAPRGGVMHTGGHGKAEFFQNRAQRRASKNR